MVSLHRWQIHRVRRLTTVSSRPAARLCMVFSVYTEHDTFHRVAVRPRIAVGYRLNVDNCVWMVRKTARLW